MTKKSTDPDKSETPHNTNLQLSFDIFNTLNTQGVQIERSKKEIGFRKNNLLITISDLTLDQKRVLDIVFFIAAQSVEPDAIQREYVKKSESGLYEVDLSFFKWLLSLTNPRNSRLKELMSSVQSARLQAEEMSSSHDANHKPNDKLKRWQTHNFFGSAAIDVPAGIAAFSVNPIFEKHIQNPQNFHFLSLRHVLPNLASKLLYDWLLLFTDYSEPITLSVDQLRKELGQDEKKSYHAFGAFNRAFLTPAIEGVNETTNLHVTMETHWVSPSNQTIGSVSFTVKRHTTQKEEEDSIREFINQYDFLHKDFGLQNNHFEEILRNRDEWNDARIEQAKDYTLARLKTGKVKSVSGYFMKALKEGYVIGELEKEMLRGENARLTHLINRESEISPLPNSGNLDALNAFRESIEATAPNPIDRKLTAQQGWEAFDEMTSKLQLETVDAFCASPYIAFVAKAVGIDASLRDELMGAVHSNERMHLEFGCFALNQKKKSKG